jgi:ligand-binding SRPBCC domain-containing protein
MDKKSQLSSTTAADNEGSSGQTSDASIVRPRAVHIIAARQEVAASLEHTFDYFGDPRNLHEITPRWLSLVVQRMDRASLERECKIDYTIRWLRIPIPWTTHIVEFDPPHRLVDTQLRGPYRYWWHEHTFEALGEDRTVMTDVVEYAMPLGPLGTLAHAMAVGRQLDAILRYRAEAIERIFPRSGALQVSRSHA